MNDKVAQIKIKQQRRQLLTNMDLFYPSPVQCSTLYRTVIHIDPSYESAAYRKDVYYLEAKGYFEFVDDQLGGANTFESKVIKLTALGLEIAQRIMTDPALEI